ncbi:MAG: right-handed parallel beta-helix repeat-containing protein [Candidatus Omnitrophota bacterium]
MNKIKVFSGCLFVLLLSVFIGTVNAQDTAVRTAPANVQERTAVRTPTATSQTSTAVRTSPVTPQAYTAERDIPISSQIESSIRTFYVDGLSGSDTTGNGSSSKPWKTIKFAVNKLAPGDVLSIMGGIYKERITITKSGSDTGRITIGAFGNGEVIIDCSPKIGEWTPYTETTIKGIYKATCSFKPTAVVVNEQPIFPAFSLTDIKENEWYYNATLKIIYLYPKAGIIPTNSNVGVISDDQYSDGILINNAHYITLYGLTVRYAGGRGISILGNYTEIRRCNVKFNGHTGINIFAYGTTRSTDTIVADNNIYHNFLRNWPRGRYKWGGWGGGAISHGTPKTQYINNVSHKNGGEGLLAYRGSAGGTVWKNNIVYDNWSVNIYIDNQPNGLIDGNIIFSSEPDTHDLYHNGDTNPGDNSNLKRLRPQGIMTADEKYGVTPTATLNNVRIINNTIVNCRKGIDHYASAPGSGLKNVYVGNNTIVVPNATSIGEPFSGLKVPYNSGNNLNVVFENNRIYATNASAYLLYLGTDPKVTTVSAMTLKDLTFKGNTWYHATRPKAFHVGPTYHTTYDFDFNGWHNICKTNCIADVYKNIATLIQPILDRIASIKATYK